MAGGYMGRLLTVDLSSGRIDTEPLDEGLCREVIGGYGLGAKLIYDRQPAGVDPLSPSNTLGFFTGPLTGTPAIIGSRFMVVGKSPLTGTWGDSNCGGFFGPHLKFAGYDGVLIIGASTKPVYLLIEDGRASLVDARELWGKSALETRDALQAVHGKDTEEVCIGPAGESQCLISAIINGYGRAAARSGLAAVMGSKQLKAIAVRGKQKVTLADEKRVEALRKEYLKSGVEMLVDFFRNYGTAGVNTISVMTGDSPVKNWRGGGMDDFPAVVQISDNAVIGEQERRYACWHCPLGCGGHLKSKAGRNTPVSHKPEYETLAAFGNLCLNGDLESIIVANDLCNSYGLDTISVGATIAFAIECYENGLITKSDTDGLELNWGNSAAIVSTLRKMARREGFGAVLADGVKRAAERIGRGADKFAIHIQGQEPAMHDTRFMPSLLLGYQLEAAPGRHRYGNELVLPPGMELPPHDKYDYQDIGELHHRLSSVHKVVDSAGLCSFGHQTYPIQTLPDFLSAVTGWEISLDECFVIGDRITTVRHVFNLREGLNPLEFRIPPVLLGQPPLAAGPVQGITLDQKAMVSDYLKVMDWDPVTAKPSKTRLEQLGLGYLVKDLY